MNKSCFLLVLVVALSLTFPLALAQSPNDDMEGCKDYALFNRMPNYHIEDCQSVEFTPGNSRSAPPWRKEAQNGRGGRRPDLPAIPVE